MEVLIFATLSKKETSNEFFFEDWNESRARIFFIVFGDILFSREEEYLKRRGVVKYLRNLRVLILEFYPNFSQALIN